MAARRRSLAVLGWLVLGAVWNSGAGGWPGATARGAGGAEVFPADGAKDLPADVQLRVTFAGPVALGPGGKIQIVSTVDGGVIDSFAVAPRAALPPAPPNVSAAQMQASFKPWPTRSRVIGGTPFVIYPVLLEGNEAIITLARPLSYGAAVTVKIDPGVFSIGGAADGGETWKFAVKSAAPAVGSQKLVVAADGSGDFCTVQGALDFVPPGNSATTILVRNGTYHEIVNFSQRNQVTLLGEDRKKTILAYPNNDRFSNSMPTIVEGGAAEGGPVSGYRRGMFQAARVTDLTVANLTLRNMSPQGASQAEAIILNGTAGARAILTNVDLYSYQDTLQINGQAYVRNCHIEGDVDFMWGTGPCFFENCTARTLRSGAFFTQIRNTAANHGYVFRQCTFEGAAGITGNFLSRIEPVRFPSSEVVLLDCQMDQSVGAVGWQLDRVSNPATAPTEKLHFWEYNSHDAVGKPVDVSRRLGVSRQLKMPEDAALIKNYSDPAWVLGGNWTPKVPMVVGHDGGG